jgi:hypothetical protein
MDAASEVFRITFAGVGAFEGFVFLWLGLRVRRHGEASVAARFVTAALGFASAPLVALNVVSPIVAYSILCFSIAAVFLADLVREERALRRRIALLSPRPAIEGVPTVWMTITLFSTLTFIPYILGGIDAIAALISLACAIAMLAIAWHIATASSQLTSEDPHAEHTSERASRARKIGLTCVVTIGTIFCFVSFAHAQPPFAWGLGRITFLDLIVLWVGLWIWQALYARRISRSGRAIST